MKSLTLLFLMLVFVFIISGCNIPIDKSVAEVIAQNYFEDIKNKDFEKALTYYSPIFFEKTNQSEWLRILKKMNSELGDLKNFHLEDWDIRTQFGTRSGTYYLLKYKVNYSKYSSLETLTLYQKKQKDLIKIIGHNINLNEFLKE